MKRRVPRLTYANIVASLALFLVVAGGSAYGATQLAKNSVGTKQLKNGAVTKAKIAESAQAALMGARGAPGAQGPPGPPGPVAKLSQTIPSGTTVTGSWNFLDPSGSIPMEEVVGLPAPAPEALTTAAVNFEAGATGLATDPDPACKGTAAEPTSPAGEVCIYSAEVAFTPNSLSGAELRPNVAASRIGFSIQTGEAGNNGRAHGTWAYTAP